MSTSAQIPPPPPGYTLDSPASSGSVPPPPPGYKLDAPDYVASRPGMPTNYGVPKELQPGMVMTRLGPMSYEAARRSQQPGIAEEAAGFGVPAAQSMKEGGRAIAMGANYAAPIMTGGASLPVQMLAQGAAAGTQEAFEAAARKILPSLPRLAQLFPQPVNLVAW